MPVIGKVARERTVLVVTHAEALAQMAARVVHMKDGKLTDGSQQT
jgi:ABC-type lipoprotein export system ATPase subunit